MQPYTGEPAKGYRMMRHWRKNLQPGYGGGCLFDFADHRHRISIEVHSFIDPRVMKYEIQQSREVTAAEFSALMESVGWGSDYAAEAVMRSLAAYPFVAHARGMDGELLGYVSAFSDGAFSTMLGELAVHPKAQGRGIARALLFAVERAYPGIPIYVKALGEAKEFFLSCGYRAPAADMTVLFKQSSAGE